MIKQIGGWASSLRSGNLCKGMVPKKQHNKHSWLYPCMCRLRSVCYDDVCCAAWQMSEHFDGQHRISSKNWGANLFMSQQRSVTVSNLRSLWDGMLLVSISGFQRTKATDAPSRTKSAELGCALQRPIFTAKSAHEKRANPNVFMS